MHLQQGFGGHPPAPLGSQAGFCHSLLGIEPTVNTFLLSAFRLEPQPARVHVLSWVLPLRCQEL